MVLIQILLFTLLVISAVNFWFSIIKLSKNKIESGSNEYYSLRLRIDALIVGITIVLGAATFIGFDTKKNIDETIKNELNQSTALLTDQTKLTDSLQKRLNNIEKRLGASNQGLAILLEDVNKSKSGIEGFFEALNRKLQPLEHQVNQLVQNASKSNIYVLNDIETDGKPKVEDRFEFQDLVTIDGKKLPEFAHPPLVLCWVDLEDLNHGVPFEMAANITSKGFTIRSDYPKDRVNMDVLIVYPIKPINP